MNYLSEPKVNWWVLDIEADSLTPKIIWTVCCINLTTGQRVDFQDKDKFVQWHKPDNVYVMHGGCRYDWWVLRDLWGVTLENFVDTEVMSRLFDPVLNNGHSLLAYGERFKLPKLDMESFEMFSPYMLKYCYRDCEITVKVFTALRKRLLALKCANEALKIEHEVALSIQQQRRDGFYFDTSPALGFKDELQKKLDAHSTAIHSLFPPTKRKLGQATSRYTQKGELSQVYLKRVAKGCVFEDYGDHGAYIFYEMVPFNVGSPLQRIEKLKSLGWEPTRVTKKGNPKVDEDSVLEFAASSGVPEVKAIAEWLVLSSRISMIDNWVSNVNQDTNCIHGDVFSCGARSRRMTHSNPNTANIPGVDKPFGADMRSFWRARPDRVLVGFDADALEGRMLLHHLNSKDAWDYFINGDPHQSNSDALVKAGLNINRKASKNYFYAFLYGATNNKLGMMYGEIGNVKGIGAKIRETLETAVPGLKGLVTQVQKEWETNAGILRTIDGGFVRCHSPHAALNYKLQPDGAVVMKKARTLVAPQLRRPDGFFVGDIHDEWQLDCEKNYAEEVGNICSASITLAGEQLGFKVPVTGSPKFGINWKETH